MSKRPAPRPTDHLADAATPDETAHALGLSRAGVYKSQQRALRKIWRSQLTAKARAPRSPARSQSSRTTNDTPLASRG